jgi:UDP-N-acetylglucosamine diphosphorylase/glucosamine-1-phosphate N-acetyltransferase
MRIIVYEDKHEKFYPLVTLFPQFGLRIGMKTIAEHTGLFFKRANISFVARGQFRMKKVVARDSTLYLSSRLLLTENFSIPRKDTRLKVGTDTVGFVKYSPPFPASCEEVADTAVAIRGSKQIKGIVLNNIWDLIGWREETLIRQYRLQRKIGRIKKGIHIIGNKKNMFVAKSAEIHKHVSFDVSDGPVYIDSGAVIRPFSLIIGPSYVGPGTIVERAKVTKSSIGPVCRIGGEVESCIFQGYSNKCHEGFIGHSFVGEWVNLGALTTNSDLKNNYGLVRVKIGRKEFDSGLMKVGCFIGDHTKLGIGTLIPTGAVIGSFVNYAGGGMLPRYVADFKWAIQEKQKPYELDKAIKTAKIVMKRRNVKMSKQYESIVRTLHDQIRRSN